MSPYTITRVSLHRHAARCDLADALGEGSARERHCERAGFCRSSAESERRLMTFVAITRVIHSGRNVVVVGIRAQPGRRRYVFITGVHTTRGLVGGSRPQPTRTEAMRILARRYRDVGVIAVVAAASFVIGAPADAATCALPVRYSTTSDTVYLTAPSSVDTLTEIKAACPGAPLVQPSPGV